MRRLSTAISWTYFEMDEPESKLCIAISELLIAAPVVLYWEQRQVAALDGLSLQTVYPKQQPLFVNPVGLFTEESCYATATDQNDHRESRDSDCSEHNDGPRRCALDEAA